MGEADSDPKAGADPQLPVGKRPTGELQLEPPPLTEVSTHKVPAAAPPIAEVSTNKVVAAPPLPAELPTEPPTRVDPDREQTQLPTRADFAVAPPPESLPTQAPTHAPGGPAKPVGAEEATELPTRGDFHLPQEEREGWGVNPPSPTLAAPPPGEATQLPTRANFNLPFEVADPPAAETPLLVAFGERIRRLDPSSPEGNRALLGLDAPTVVRPEGPVLTPPHSIDSLRGKGQGWGAEGLAAFDDEPLTYVVPPTPKVKPRRRISLIHGRTPLLAALACGFLGVVWALGSITSTGAAVRKGWELVPVVVAARDIPEGTPLTYDLLAQRAVPIPYVGPAVVKPDSTVYVVNQKVLVPLQAGNPLLWSQLDKVRAAEHLARRVIRRARAVSIWVERTQSVGGWVRPDDRVDVIAAFRDPTTGGKDAVTLLQNVFVLSAGNMNATTNIGLLAERKREYRNISLMVMPEEAEALVLAAELGSLRLTLRNGQDDGLQTPGYSNFQTLLSLQRARALRERRDHLIEVIRGEAR